MAHSFLDGPASIRPLPARPAAVVVVVGAAVVVVLRAAVVVVVGNIVVVVTGVVVTGVVVGVEPLGTNKYATLTTEVRLATKLTATSPSASSVPPRTPTLRGTKW
jgi:hypothetical protein